MDKSLALEIAFPERGYVSFDKFADAKVAANRTKKNPCSAVRIERPMNRGAAYIELRP